MRKAGDDAFAKTICSICYEDLKPIHEDLQAISICGHVFHELCLQQWFEYCPAGKKSSCPVCKQACSQKSAIRLYFQSMNEASQSVPSQSSSDCNVDAEELRQEVKKLEGKISGMNFVFGQQQQQLNELNEELSLTRQRIKREEELKEHAQLEKATIGQMLQSKIMEFDKLFNDRTRLQERCLALSKELATLKLVSDVNLDEEQMTKLACVGGGGNTNEASDILKKSLVLRNQKYKALMAQCNLLGRGEILSQKKLDKAEEKIKKLKVRLQELERVLEEKENNALRTVHLSMKTIKMEVDQAKGPVNSKIQSEETAPGKPFLTSFKSTEGMAKGQTELHGKTIKQECIIIDLDEDIDTSSVDVPIVKSIQSSGQPSSASVGPLYSTVSAEPFVFGSKSHSGGASSKTKNIEKVVEEDIIVLSPQASAVEKLDAALENGPVLQIKRENHEAVTEPGDNCFSPALMGPEGASRYLGKWCKRGLNKVSSSGLSGDLIAVGADGRGGKIKVLKSPSQPLDGDNSFPILPKRCKFGIKENRSQGSLQIEHYFIKKQTS
ncbi:hypothetical protein H6P81_008189 [Aristolochia fimbriata]|uniref:RING-type domain-containing protein n=1 Tax=Aristolochia fimbriata TaxID=158543 RepID=A0AAV7F2B4_ARIFI|nr:hypothetical protein H6P81_008189 [Aristolochia fimbriata]